MEFKFDPSAVLRKPICVFTGESLPRNRNSLEKVIEIIDEIGVASAKAQNLRGPVTTAQKLMGNPSHRVYIMKHDDGDKPRHIPVPLQHDTFGLNALIGVPPDEHAGYRDRNGPGPTTKVVGLLKVGEKDLFVLDEYMRHIQITPVCVLDFYVHESFQRKGYGKGLFDYMLSIEMQRPGHLAYDRPSPRLMAFLRKNYQLSEFIPQGNNFVIYKEYGLSSLQLGGPFETNRTGRTTQATSKANPAALPAAGMMAGGWQVKDFRRKQLRSRDGMARQTAGPTGPTGFRSRHNSIAPLPRPPIPKPTTPTSAAVNHFMPAAPSPKTPPVLPPLSSTQAPLEHVPSSLPSPISEIKHSFLPRLEPFSSPHSVSVVPERKPADLGPDWGMPRRPGWKGGSELAAKYGTFTARSEFSGPSTSLASTHWDKPKGRRAHALGS
ncbi:touch receptor neuron protein Mec-17-domain-containing protein [Phlyctochytrium arcticum]|nr:touch receptor neuron protein Mec-17-domain-containing protein [Phlyctochytrium arcticum]